MTSSANFRRPFQPPRTTLLLGTLTFAVMTAILSFVNCSPRQSGTMLGGQYGKSRALTPLREQQTMLDESGDRP